MARPKGTYVSSVFNFGVDKNIPFGFVDVVFDNSGNAVGFEKDGKFYNLGEKVAKKEEPAKQLTSNQLLKKVDLLERKLNLNKTQASNKNISQSERNKFISEYKKAQDELALTKRLQIEAEVKEGKLKEQQARAKAADALRFEIRSLEERKKFLQDLGQKTTEVDVQISNKRKQLGSVTNITQVQYKSSNVVPPSGMPFGGKSVTGRDISKLEPIPTTATGPTGPGKDSQKPGTETKATGPAITETTATGDKGKTKEQRYADAVAMAMREYNMPDIIFRNVKSLGELLKKYVDDKLTNEQFALEIQNDPWYRSNSAEIKARYVQLFNYEDLVKQGRAMGTTDYEQQIARITRNIQARARELNGIEIPDDQAKLIAKDLYIFNLSDDPAVLTERLVSFIRPSGGMIGGQPTIGYGGQALQNYQNLQAIAKANGFKLEDILPKDAMGKPMTAEGILEQLALGKLDINRIAQDVRKLAAVGQPDYVKDLLGQGYDLENIYAPYRERMSTVLELDPNTISLNDPTLRMGISKEGDMNLYDFEKALRRDSRWQYTQNARSEVSGSVLQVLRDFGFQG